jgi:hypothetical protein
VVLNGLRGVAGGDVGAVKTISVLSTGDLYEMARITCLVVPMSHLLWHAVAGL